MSIALEMKLLQLTKQAAIVELQVLAKELRVQKNALEEDLEALRKDGFISVMSGRIELDTHQRVRLGEHLIRKGHDPKKISRLFEWQEFETFASDVLGENGFHIVKRLVFKARDRRREIDILAWNDNLTLTIDCKHWPRGMQPSQAQAIAQAQIERASLLASRPDILRKHRLQKLEARSIIPVIFCLGDPRRPIVDGVPVVSVSKLISFIYGISPFETGLRMIPVRAEREQRLLF